MAERVWQTEPTLTERERATKADLSTRIQIDHSYSRPAIQREWVRGTAGDDALYGYAEKRVLERQYEGKLDLTVSGALDVVELAKVILAEIQRQQAPPIHRPGEIVEVR